MQYFLGDAASDVFDLGCGEPAGVMLVYGLPEQAPDQCGGWDVFGGGPLA